jgi:hypothetical protein
MESSPYSDVIFVGTKLDEHDDVRLNIYMKGKPDFIPEESVCLFLFR